MSRRPLRMGIELARQRARIMTIFEECFPETNLGSSVMKFPCTVNRLGDDRWLARSSGSRLGTVEVTAGSRDEALAKLRGELRYRVELCPCTGVPDDYVELEVRGAE